MRSSLAASTGVETADDVAAYLLAGADVVMTTSALLRHGPGHVTALLDGLTAWMDRKGIGSVSEIRGLLAPAPDTPQPGFGRYGYLSAVEQATGPIPPGSVWCPRRRRGPQAGRMSVHVTFPRRGRPRAGDLRPYQASPDQPMFYGDEVEHWTSISSWPEITRASVPAERSSRIPLSEDG